MGRQIGTSPGRSNRIFRGRPGDVGGGRSWDVLGTNICCLGVSINFLPYLSLNFLANEKKPYPVTYFLNFGCVEYLSFIMSAQ